MSHLVSRIRHGGLSVPRRRRRQLCERSQCRQKGASGQIQQGRRSRTDRQKRSKNTRTPASWTTPIETFKKTCGGKLPGLPQSHHCHRRQSPMRSDVHFRPIIRSRAPADVLREHTRSRGVRSEGLSQMLKLEWPKGQLPFATFDPFCKFGRAPLTEPMKLPRLALSRPILS